MKIVIVTYPLSTPHFEWGLELIQTHLDKGDEVILLTCHSEMTSCELNYSHQLSGCVKCVQRLRAGLKRIEGPVKEHPLINLTPEDQEKLRQLPVNFATLQELKDYIVDGFDLGMAVASGLISVTRNSRCDPSDHQDLVHRLLIAGLSAFRSFENHLRSMPIDRAYILNGRLPTMRACLRACQRRNVDCFVYEMGCSPEHLRICKNTGPHDYGYVVNDILRSWEKAAGDTNREEIASRFYRDRARGKERFWYSWTKAQRPGQLPGDWDSACHNIAIFNSSEDEYAAIGKDWENPLYPDQLEGLQRLRADLPKLPDKVRLYLRIHPNLRGVDHDLKPLLALNGPRFTVIPPESPVGSYALLHQCNTVLTYGSTIGIEAVFWGKPSILAGIVEWRDFGATYNPASHEELLALLSRPLEPRALEGALKYGYYMHTFGEKMKHYVPDGFNRGRFRGRSINWGRLTHYGWALVHRVPWLNRILNDWHYARSHKYLMGLAPGKRSLRLEPAGGGEFPACNGDGGRIG